MSRSHNHNRGKNWISFVFSSLRLSGGVLLAAEYANRLANRGRLVAFVSPQNETDNAVREALHPDVEVLEAAMGLPRPTLSKSKLFRLALSLTSAIPPSEILVATHTPTTFPVLLGSRLMRKGAPIWLYMDYMEMFKNRPLELLLLRHAPAWFEGIATISRPLQEEVVRRTRAKVVMTGSGLRRPDLFCASPVRPARSNGRTLLYIGDDRLRKGLRDFLDAAEIAYQNVPDLNLIIASKTKADFSTSVPHEIHIRPTDEELAFLYRKSDVFVSTSWGEGLGYPPLEAMACGTPVIVTDSSGVLDYACDRENCLIVPPREPVSIAAAIRTVLADERLRVRMVENGYRTAARYDWDRAVDRFESLIENVLGESKR